MPPEAHRARPTLVERWRDTGWLRPIDAAFARFLAETGGEDDEITLLLAALASQQLGMGHICLPVDRLLADPATLLAGETGGAAPAPAFPAVEASAVLERLAASVVVSDGPGGAPLVLDAQRRLYLRRYWQYEQTVAAGLHRLLARRPTPPPDLGDRLATLFPEPAGAEPNWPRIACALAARAGLTVLTGGPGTGKTTTVVRLLGLLQGLAVEAGAPLRIRLAAPTGKAAARLTESIGERIATLPLEPAVRERIPGEVSTLHRLLGRRPGSRHFRHDRRNPLHADLVVVDEASMIDLEMMASLLAALAPETRLVLLGDKDQLASVEAGAVMGDLCDHASAGRYDEDTVAWVDATCGEDISAYAGTGDALARQTVMLRANHRFGRDSGIGALARAINEGDAAGVEAAWDAPAGDVARYTLHDREDPRLEALCVAGYRPCLEAVLAAATATDPEAAALDALRAFARFQLLTALRDGPTGVAGLNRRIARALQREGLLPRVDGWYPGRPVLVTRNDYALGLMNGDVGITLPVPDADAGEPLRVAFQLPDGSVRRVLPSRLGDVETAFAMTVHKAQGSEFAHTALVLPDTPHPVLTRELLYTAVTRASERFSLLLVHPEVLAAGVARPTLRASGLAAALEAHGGAAQ